MAEQRWRSISQLIPNPDVFGVADDIKAYPEEGSDVTKILQSADDRCFSISFENKNVLGQAVRYTKDVISSSDDGRLSWNVKMPSIQITLTDKQASPNRLLTEIQENAVVEFLKKVGFLETTVNREQRDFRHFALAKAL